MDVPNQSGLGKHGAVQPPTLDDTGIHEILAEVASWRSEADSKHQHQLDEVDEEVARLKNAIEDLQRQLTALGDLRHQLESKGAQLDAQEARKAHEGVFARLAQQAVSLAERVEPWRQAQQRRQDALAEALADSELGPVVAEFRRVEADPEALSTLPTTYRDAALAHHEATRAKLRAFADEADPGPQEIDAGTLSLDLVFTVDHAEAEPELVSFVLPVDEAVYGRWSDHPDDLRILVAARVVQGLYRASHALGTPGAHAMHGGHRGLLAVEVELDGADDDADVVAMIREHVDQTLQAAPELRAAGLTLRLHHVPVDYLLPPAPVEVNDAA